MRVTRRLLVVTLHRWWLPLLFTHLWVGLLFLALYTGEAPRLISGTLLIIAVLGGIHFLGSTAQVIRASERDIAASAVESVSVPRGTAPRVAEQMEEFRAQIVRHIRGHGAHLREVSHG